MNQSSLELNERGPALKVFWPRNDSGWAQGWCRARLPRPTRVVIEPLTKKTEPEGARQEKSGRLLSVRNLGEEDISSKRARPRWLTERIALVSLGS